MQLMYNKTGVYRNQITQLALSVRGSDSNDPSYDLVCSVCNFTRLRGAEGAQNLVLNFFDKLEIHFIQ